jgi:hypothetical protein
MSKLPFSMESWTMNSSWNNLRDLKRKAKSTRCFHLKQALYGLKQVALQWWQALDKSMEAMGFKHLKSDSGVFVLMHSGRPEIIVIVYVDDAVFLG